jgi:8-oxo-dGTP diphosphatase
MPVTAQLATLGYVLSADRTQVLLVHRNRRASDAHLGKYNGLGGKLEPTESVVAGLCRELREEANVECQTLRLRGTVSWPGFGNGGETWFGFIFLVEQWTGTIPPSNAEGDLVWRPIAELLAGHLPLWPGDRYFLPLVFGTERRQFHGLMPYADGQPVSWHYDWVEV